MFSLVVFATLCHQGFVIFIYFELSGFPLSLVYSLVVFATLWLEIRTNLRLGVSIVMIAIFCKSFANQKQPGAVKKAVAKQSRIKSIVWHLRWLVRTRADISLLPSGLVYKTKKLNDIKLSQLDW